MNKTKELWKQIPDFKNYEASNTGKIRVIKTGKLRSASKNKSGYFALKLTKEEKSYGVLVHRKIAETWIDNPKKLKQVNHLNGKEDNSADSLEWCTKLDNHKHAAKNITTYHTKAIYQIDKDTNEIIKKYDAMQDAADDGYLLNDKFTKFNIGHISAVANGKRNTHGGYKWKFLDEKIIDNKDLPGEKWINLSKSTYKEVKKYINYNVSNMGRVKKDCGKFIKAQDDKTIKLSKDNKDKRFLLHRLMMMAFNIPIPEKYKDLSLNELEVDHIDSESDNNYLKNLQWSDRKDNMNNPNTLNKTTSPVEVTIDNEIIIFDSIEEAMKELGMCSDTIQKYAKNGEEYKEMKFKVLNNKLEKIANNKKKYEKTFEK